MSHLSYELISLSFSSLTKKVCPLSLTFLSLSGRGRGVGGPWGSHT